MHFIYRDDDPSGWSDPKEVIQKYDFLINNGIKISAGVIPVAVKSFNLGNPAQFYQDFSKIKSINENPELVDYLAYQCRLNNLEIMLHGFNHSYFLKNHHGKFIPADFSNTRLIGKTPTYQDFNAEYSINDYPQLLKKTQKGKSLLEDIFKTKVKNFVPPSNELSKHAVKAIHNCGLNISGIIGFDYNREVSLIGLKSYFKRILFRIFSRGITFPQIMDYGNHKELVSHSLTSSTNLDKLYSQMKYCMERQLPFQINSHYWELNEHNLIEIFNTFKEKNYHSGRLSEILK